MNSGIYQIKNLENNKVYIGSSKHLDKRKKQHFSMLINNKHHSVKLQRAYNKAINKNVFSFRVLEKVAEDKLFEREQYYIDKLKGYSEGYNCCKFANKPSFENVYRNGFPLFVNKKSVALDINTKLPKELSWSDKGRINELRHHLLGKNQLLVYVCNKKQLPMNFLKLSQVFKITISQTRRLIQKLIKHNVITHKKINKVHHFYLNEIYGKR